MKTNKQFKDSYQNYETWTVAKYISEEPLLRSYALQVGNYRDFVNAMFRHEGITHTPDETAFNDSNIDFEFMDQFIVMLKYNGSKPTSGDNNSNVLH